MEKLSEQTLVDMLAETAEQVTVGAEYRHYKNKTYRVLDLAILEATNEVSVIYQAQYGEQLKFVRTASDWLESVEWQGEQVPRFTIESE